MDNHIADKLNYNFRSSFKKGGMNIEATEFQKDNLYLKLWGALDNDLLRLNGNLLSQRPIEATLKRKLFLKIPDKINDKLKTIFSVLEKDKPPIPEFIGPFKSGLNIFDLACLVQFVPGGLQIKNLNFSLGETPFSLKGYIPVFGDGEIDLRFSSFPNQPEEERFKNPKRIDLRLKGNLADAKFNGQFDFEFMRNLKTRQSLQQIAAIFENLNFDFVAYHWLRASLDKADISYRADDNTYNISFNDFSCLFNPAQKKAKFNSAVYDGYLEGEAIIDLTRLPFKASLKSNIKDVSANQLSRVSDYFSKVYGKLSGQVNYENYPASVLNGNLSIREGYLDNLRFFSWLADFFSMSKLKKVGFQEISADFLVDDEVSALENIKLDSPEIGLGGYFNISTDDLVSGELSLILSEKLLDSSPKFQRLLRLIGKDLSTVSFNFQMSGLYENMNFKWLDSEFKNGLKNLLPAGRERKIETEIESAIESISADK
ncbi:MAG: hypothetical protein FJZ11_06510 [Candidatus Omnitrophica bacterium]|nr:hypothetical protein [Candidatus Omnitrophota bacterium]